MKRLSILKIVFAVVFSFTIQGALAAGPELITATTPTSSQVSAAGPSASIDISPDGRFVLLSSVAPNLTPLNLRNGSVNSYVAEPAANAITLASVNVAG